MLEAQRKLICYLHMQLLGKWTFTKSEKWNCADIWVLELCQTVRLMHAINSPVPNHYVHPVHNSSIHIIHIDSDPPIRWVLESGGGVKLVRAGGGRY